MNARLSKIVLSLALAALTAASCQTPVTVTPTALPSATPAPPPTATPATTGERINQGIDGIMQDLMDGGAMTACSVAVVLPDENGAPVRTLHNFGALDKDGKTPVDENTEYEIGSLSKLFTATVLAVENLNGTMPTGDPVQKYMPQTILVPSLGGRDITLHQLATHTSGLPRKAQYIGGKRKVDGVVQQGYASDDNLAQALKAFHLARVPGSAWEYSNVGYGLLGMAESQALDLPYEVVVVNEVAAPLGMSHTRVTLTAAEASNAAQGYDSLGAEAVPFTTRGDLLGAGGLRSTIDDLAIFLEASIAPDKTPLAGALALTQQPLVNGPDPAVSQAYGWLISNAGRPDEVYFKAGLTQGFSSYIAFSSVTHTGFAVMCNAPGVSQAVPKLNALFDQPSTPVEESEVIP